MDVPKRFCLKPFSGKKRGVRSVQQGLFGFFPDLFRAEKLKKGKIRIDSRKYSCTLTKTIIKVS